MEGLGSSAHRLHKGLLQRFGLQGSTEASGFKIRSAGFKPRRAKIQELNDGWDLFFAVWDVRVYGFEVEICGFVVQVWDLGIVVGRGEGG